MFNSKLSQRGSTLVGVLIAMVIAGIGLYALMQTQGSITSGISSSKARGEAMERAQHKIAELNAYIEKAQFDSDIATTTKAVWASSPGTNIDSTSVNPTLIPGVNADFYQEWIIREPTEGSFKEVMVKISWNDEAGDLLSVYLNNFIYFNSPSLSAAIKDELDGTASRGKLTRRGRWGDEKAEDGTTAVPGNTTPLPIPADGTESHLGLNSNGNWEIYLGLAGSRTPDSVVLTAFGGIIHEIKGRVYFNSSGFAKDELAVLATSPAYCIFPICTEVRAEGLDCDVVADYACYVPGDCSNETSFSSANDDCQFGLNSTGSVVKLSDSTDPTLVKHLKDIKDMELDGGWYGKIGLLLLEDVGPGQIPLACLKDLIPPEKEITVNIGNTVDFSTVSSTIPEFSNDTPARYHVARRIINDATALEGKSVQQFEGVNRSLACQDILFTDAGGGTTCENAASDPIGGNKPGAGLIPIDGTSSPYFEYDNQLRNIDNGTPNFILDLKTYGDEEGEYCREPPPST